MNADQKQIYKVIAKIASIAEIAKIENKELAAN